MKISFVILHYLTIEDTKECIESILNNIKYEDINIIIVDNGSPNHSGKELESLYLLNTKVHIILNNENVGFAKGNNIGFLYAKNNLQTDFIILINNDTIIEQNNFCDNLLEVFVEKKFDICGPKIISLIDSKNQNPEKKFFESINDVRKMRIKFTFLYIISFLRIDNLVIETLNIKKKFNISHKEKNNEIQLHGSCLIFSPKYINKYNGLFDKTFMYLEECILKYISDRDGLSMVYTNKLMIYHKEDSATDAYMKKKIAKRRFYYKNSIESTKQLVKLMKSDAYKGYK